MIENKPNEITVIYNSEKHDDKKARGYAESLHDYTVKTLDLAREPITETQLAQLAEKMNVHVRDLIDTTYGDYAQPSHNELPDLDEGSYFKMMARNPMIISTPILIIGNKAQKFGSGYNIIQEDFSYGLDNPGHGNIEEKKDR